MPRRIEIELTSCSDGTWTWRAAGAKLPKGTLTADMVPNPAAVGDVLRAEVETGLDGIEIVSLDRVAEKVDEGAANRIEVLGAPRPAPNVSVTYAPGGRPRRDGDDGPPRRSGERPGRREGARRESRGERPRTGPGRGDRAEGSERRERPPRRERKERVAGEEGAEPRGRESRPEGSDRRREGPPPVRRERKPTVSTAHRNALLAGLGPEQLPVAEQLLRGGIPAVRQAIAEQHRAGGPASTNADPLLAIAEQLLPAVNLASWKDRASNAQALGKELRLRELRAVVAASRTVNLDDEGREIAKALREALDHRVTAIRDSWVKKITSSIESGRVLDALQTATKPPDPGTRLPADLAVKLAEAAGAAMTAELDPAQWQALLTAVIDCPVRRTVRPAGIPPVEEAHAAARHAAGFVPELAKLLGLKIPPPPPRRTAYRLTPTGGGA